MMRKRFLISLLVFATSVHATSNVTNSAIPTKILINNNNGMMIYGSFGNPSNCNQSNRIYLKSTHPQYQQISSLLLTAYAGKYKVKGSTASCETVTDSTGNLDTSKTVNIIDSTQPVEILS